MMSTRRAADDEADPRRGLACGDLGSALAVGAHGLEKDVEEAERYDETFLYTVLQYLQYLQYLQSIIIQCVQCSDVFTLINGDLQLRSEI